MLNLKPSGQVDPRTHLFLEQNPAISESLIEELGQNLSQVATFIEPILNAPSRCEISSNYIQAVTTGRTAFLTTNLTNNQSTQVTGLASSWLIGRSSNCAIAILEKSISRCHASICCFRYSLLRPSTSARVAFKQEPFPKPTDSHPPCR